MLTALDLLKFKTLEDLAQERKIYYHKKIIRFWAIEIFMVEGDEIPLIFTVEDALNLARDERDIIPQKAVKRMQPIIAFEENPLCTQEKGFFLYDKEKYPLIKISAEDIRDLFELYMTKEYRRKASE